MSKAIKQSKFNCPLLSILNSLDDIVLAPHRRHQFLIINATCYVTIDDSFVTDNIRVAMRQFKNKKENTLTQLLN